MKIWELDKGSQYEVIHLFHDYDESSHPKGERWFFEELNYMPKTGFYFLFVKDDNDIIKGFRLFNHPQHQKDLIENFMKYLRILTRK